MAIVSQADILFAMLHFLATFCSLAVGGFVFAFSFANDSCNNIRSLEKMVKTKQSETDIYEQFTGFVGLHANCKQLSRIFDIQNNFEFHE